MLEYCSCPCSSGVLQYTVATDKYWIWKQHVWKQWFSPDVSWFSRDPRDRDQHRADLSAVLLGLHLQARGPQQRSPLWQRRTWENVPCGRNRWLLVRGGGDLPGPSEHAHGWEDRWQVSGSQGDHPRRQGWRWVLSNNTRHSFLNRKTRKQIESRGARCFSAGLYSDLGSSNTGYINHSSFLMYCSHAQFPL